MSEGLKSITVKFLGDVTGLAGAAEAASKSLEGVSSAAEKSSGGWDKFAKASLAAGTVLTGVLLDGIKNGIENVNELNASNTALQSVLNNMPDTLGLTTKALDEQADALQGSTTFTRDQILAADQLLLKNSGVTAAIKAGVTTQEDATQTVLDFAQATGVDASTAATKYAKILDQPFTATKSLAAAGVVLTASQTTQLAAYKKSGDVVAAQSLLQQALTDKLHGTADAAGKTLPAKLQQAKEAFGDAEGELTTALIPALSTVVGWVTKIADWAQKNPAQFKVVVEVLGGLAGVLVAIGVATKIWSAAVKVYTGVQAALDVVLDASPIFIIGGIIIAIGAAFVIAYEKSKTFRDIVNGAFNAVKDTVLTVVNFIKDHWLALVTIVFGPIGLAIGEIVTHFSQLENAAKDVFAAIKKAYDDSGIGTIVSAVGKIASVGGSVIGKIAGAFADGGNVGTSGSYLVGERGPEVVNLRGGSSVVPNHQLGNSTGGGSQVTQVLSGGTDITKFVTSIVSSNTRATKNAVRAGGSRAFV